MKYLKAMFFLIFFLIPVFYVYPAIANENTQKSGYELLSLANLAYKKGDFQSAKQYYEKLIQTVQTGGDIFYNLGNCYVRLNRPGKAILNYERAKRIMRRNADLEFNLQYIRDKIQADKDIKPRFFFFQWLGNFTRAEIIWSFMIINLMFWAVLILRLWIRVEWSFYLLLSLCFLWLISGACVLSDWYWMSHDKRAVVINSQTLVYAGPSENDTTLFSLTEGTMVKYERKEGGWLLIRMNEEKRGWARIRDVERIVLPENNSIAAVDVAVKYIDWPCL